MIADAAEGSAPGGQVPGTNLVQASADPPRHGVALDGTSAHQTVAERATPGRPQFVNYCTRDR
jgi:hypothetical protein